MTTQECAASFSSLLKPRQTQKPSHTIDGAQNHVSEPTGCSLVDTAIVIRLGFCCPEHRSFKIDIVCQPFLQFFDISLLYVPEIPHFDGRVHIGIAQLEFDEVVG